MVSNSHAVILYNVFGGREATKGNTDYDPLPASIRG